MKGEVDVLAVMAADAYDARMYRREINDNKGVDELADSESAYAAVADLIASSQKTIKAFESLGKACGAVSVLKARAACEEAMLAQKAALSRLTGAA
jgi:hypothetical protein